MENNNPLELKLDNVLNASPNRNDVIELILLEYEDALTNRLKEIQEELKSNVGAFGCLGTQSILLNLPTAKKIADLYLATNTKRIQKMLGKESVLCKQEKFYKESRSSSNDLDSTFSVGYILLKLRYQTDEMTANFEITCNLTEKEKEQINTDLKEKEKLIEVIRKEYCEIEQKLKDLPRTTKKFKASVLKKTLSKSEKGREILQFFKSEQEKITEV
jgi:hypothetical protein